MFNRTSIVVAVALATTAAAQAAPLTSIQTLDRRSIGDLQFSPDGRRLAFTVTEPPQATTRPRHVWMLDVATGTARQMTSSDKSEWSPRWSPDGRALALLSDRDGSSQLYLLSMSGGEAERLTPAADVRAFRWSPDGTRIALLAPEPKSAALERREQDKDDAHIVDLDDRHPQLWILEVARRTLRQVTHGSRNVSDIEWLPDGRRLVAIANDKPASDQWIDRLYTIDAPDGHVAEIAAPRGPFRSLAVSPDGRTIAYVGARVDGPEPHDLWLQPVAGGQPTNVTGGAPGGAPLDRPIRQIQFADGDTVIAVSENGFKSGLVRIALKGPAFVGVDGVPVNPGAFAAARNGTLAFVGETATRAPEVWIRPSTGRARPVTRLNARWDAIPVAAPEFIRYASFDGTSIEAALLRPSGATGRLPLIVLVHGGPTGRWSDAFEPWGQLLAARGYAVLYPNVRGSTGYGERFVEMNRADWGGGDFKDVMAGVDAMVARGIADPERLGIGGWSYGGYMAAWAVTQTARFQAAVSGAPVIDMASEFGTERGPAYDHWFYGLPYEKLDGFIKSSPITYVKNAKTPTLLLQGEEDRTDPIGQSQQFYRGLKWYGVPSELVLYPREDHGLREEKHLLDRLDRVIAWFNTYLKPGPTSLR
jgi:dipeptidyl aminopeptidase/acylaminoacyl peptidase